MATLSVTTFADLDDIELAGSLTVPITLTVTGDIHRAVKTIDAAGFDRIWSTGNSGLVTFDVLIIEVTVDMWVELRNDHSSGAEYVVVEVTATSPLILTSDNLGTSTASQLDGVAFAANTEYGLIDAIDVQNDGALAGQVKLTLVT